MKYKKFRNNIKEAIKNGRKKKKKETKKLSYLTYVFVFVMILKLDRFQVIRHILFPSSFTLLFISLHFFSTFSKLAVPYGV